jgi:hypothetical protein
MGRLGIIFLNIAAYIFFILYNCLCRLAFIMLGTASPPETNDSFFGSLVPLGLREVTRKNSPGPLCGVYWVPWRIITLFGTVTCQQTNTVGPAGDSLSKFDSMFAQSPERNVHYYDPRVCGPGGTRIEVQNIQYDHLF